MLAYALPPKFEHLTSNLARMPLLDDLHLAAERLDLEQGGAGMCSIATLSSNYTKGRKIIVKPAALVDKV